MITQSTGNLMKHYEHLHPNIALNAQQHQQNSHASSDSSFTTPSSFFAPRPRKPPIGAIDNTKYRELLLDFIVANNLALRLVESKEYRTLVEFLNLYVKYLYIN